MTSAKKNPERDEIYSARGNDDYKNERLPEMRKNVVTIKNNALKGIIHCQP